MQQPNKLTDPLLSSNDLLLHQHRQEAEKASQVQVGGGGAGRKRQWLPEGREHAEATWQPREVLPASVSGG